MPDDAKQKKLTKIPPHARMVFSGNVFDVYQWDQELFDGTIGTFEAIARADAVAVIPIIDEKLVVIREEQPGRSPYYAFPGGSMDPGETPLEAAKRELYEETGMTFEHMKLVQVDDIGGNRIDWNCYRFIATGLLDKDAPHLDAGEKIEVSMLDFEETRELAKGNIYMSHTIMEVAESIEDLHKLEAIKQV